MNQADILTALPTLTLRQRCEVLERLLELETDADLLRDADRRADERFLMLDQLETEDGASPPG